MTPGSEKNTSYCFVSGLITFVIIFSIVWALWRVFMDANGVLKFYTPMYGFSLVAVWLASILVISKVFEFYPFDKANMTGAAGIGRGLMLTVLSLFLMLFITYGIFWNFIGKFGVAYFSPNSIVISGGSGAEPFIARENASTAIIYFVTAFIWWALAWDLGFGLWPWQGASQGVRGWSRFCAISILTVLTYAVLFHPHICQLFYPPQDKAGVAPWWAEYAGTGSAFFSLGLALCSLKWVVLSDLMWDGYPWRFLDRRGEGNFIRGVATLIGSVALGIISMVILLRIMNIFWMEPFEGGQYTDAPYFRYLHAGEISGFIVLAAFILKTYFNNFPNLSTLPLTALFRTIVSFIGGGVFYMFYYSTLSVWLLGKVPGIAQPDDTPLVWTMLFLSVVIVHAQFFGAWPVRRPTS
ncbi:MAG: hypothetical protein ACLPVO_15295 [Desulfomonilaceae bacterium]